MESAPPEHATSTSGAARARVRGEARRLAREPRATGGGRVMVGEDVVEYAADRQAYRRDRRMGTHVRFPS